jgi:hypothetical protein
MIPLKLCACAALFRRILIAALLLALPFGLPAQLQSKSHTDTNTSSTPQVLIKTTAVTSSSVTVSVNIPGKPEKFSAHLNGKDVSSRFSPASCDGATCKTVTLAQPDGFQVEKMYSPSMRAME